MTLRVVIVDDEPPARRKLLKFLAATEGVEVVGEAGDGTEAVATIREAAPDLVFLDIQMPALTGFEVIEAIGADVMPVVVFVTAYDEYAIDAFDVEAVDYLLKPYTRMRFDRAFSRARARCAQTDSNAERGDQLGRLLDALRPGESHLKRLVVNENGRVFFVPVADVLYFRSSGNYVEAHLGDNYHLVRKTTTRLLQRLDPTMFVRIHRTTLVNVEAIAEMTSIAHGDYDVVLHNGTSLRMSRRYARALLER